MTDQKTIDAMVNKITELRKKAGVCAVKYDDRLGRSAEKHVADLAAGRARPHDGFPDRVWVEQKFPQQQCGNRSGFGNISEGVSWGSAGFSAEELVSILNDNGAHGQDFRDPVFNLVGVAYLEGEKGTYVVVEYGCLCKGDDRPEPIMKKKTEEDFGMFTMKLTRVFSEKFPEYV